ncbi:hypothetical protein [Jatrophihabitans sp.]|uniref:hypothetical protein n=1 Tax=Jatrophihabitans sp. TaxID=1932789 RepID=UPI0030C729B1
MADLRRLAGRTVFALFVLVLFVVLAYYLLQQIPSAQRPTLRPTTSVTLSG